MILMKPEARRGEPSAAVAAERTDASGQRAGCPDAKVLHPDALRGTTYGKGSLGRLPILLIFILARRPALLKLLLENRFPRIWMPSVEERDQRQLLLHRHKLVEMRVRVKNELQHLAMNRGITRGRRMGESCCITSTW